LMGIEHFRIFGKREEPAALMPEDFRHPRLNPLIFFNQL
jgi:hypothetical protein